MKTFDLKAALVGKPVCTREGRKVPELKVFTSIKDPTIKSVVFSVEGEGILRTAFTDGHSLASRHENKFDLFMTPVKKYQLVWQHTTGVAKGQNYFGSIHSSRHEAEIVANGSMGGSKKFLGIFEYEE